MSIPNASLSSLEELRPVFPPSRGLSGLWSWPGSIDPQDRERFLHVLRSGTLDPEQLLVWSELQPAGSQPADPGVLLGPIANRTREAGLPTLHEAGEEDAALIEALYGVEAGSSLWFDSWSEIDLTSSIEVLLEQSRERVGQPSYRLETQALPGMEHARDLLFEGIEAFNVGDLSRANELLWQADELVRRAFLDRSLWRGVKEAARDRVDLVHLFELAKNPGCHAHLREFLRIFPRWRVRPLLRRLAREESRRSRRRILTLLTVHGWETRKEAADRLVRAATSSITRLPWYLTRNLIFLLRNLQEGRQVSDYELAGVLSFADLSQPGPVVQEAVGYLGMIDDTRSERRLISLLETVEGSSKSVRAELDGIHHQLLDRLLRRSSERTRLLALDRIRGFGQKGPFSVVECLGNEDLTRYPRLTQCLLEMLREVERGRWFSRPSRSDIQTGQSLIRSLASTNTPEVRSELYRIEQRSRRPELRQLAASTLGRLDRLASRASDLPISGPDGLAPALEDTGKWHLGPMVVGAS